MNESSSTTVFLDAFAPLEMTRSLLQKTGPLGDDRERARLDMWMKLWKRKLVSWNDEGPTQTLPGHDEATLGKDRASLPGR